MSENLARLRAFMHDGDAQTRGMAALALAKVAGPEAEELLIELLSDPDPRVVCVAIQSLGDRGSDSAVPALLPFMQSPDQDLVCSCIAALAQIRATAAFAPIVVCLFDVRDEVRRNAAAAIGRLGDLRALEPLQLLLEDPYHWVRSNAALSLGALGQAASAPALLRMLQSETEPVARANALMALLRCNPESWDYVMERAACPDEPEQARISALLGISPLLSDASFTASHPLVAEAAQAACCSIYQQEACPDELRPSTQTQLAMRPPAPCSSQRCEIPIAGCSSMHWSPLRSGVKWGLSPKSKA